MTYITYGSEQIDIEILPRNTNANMFADCAISATNLAGHTTELRLTRQAAIKLRNLLEAEYPN